MLIKTIYECGKCSKEYGTQKECESCELSHNIDVETSSLIIKYIPSKFFKIHKTNRRADPTIWILVDSMENRHVVKSNRMYKIKMTDELEWNNLIETNSLQLMNLFMSKDKNFNQLAKQKIIKLMGL